MMTSLISPQPVVRSLRRMAMLQWLVLVVPAMSAKCENKLHHGDIYHRRTDTCVRIFPSKKAWPDALETCLSMNVSRDRVSQGYLVRIDAEDTARLIRDVLRKAGHQDAWIGLRYTEKGYRWQEWVGLADRSVTFFKWRYPSPLKDLGKPFTVVGVDTLWREVADSYQAVPLCQFPSYGADLNPSASPSLLHMTCPSQVLKEGETVYIPLAYYTRDFNQTRCYVPGIESPVASRLKGEPGTVARSGFNLVMIRKDQSIFSYQSYSKRPPDGRWSCQIVNDKGDQSLGSEAFCEFQFIFPPKSLNCHYDRHSNGLFVSCTCPKVYPKALYEFTYSYGSHDFQWFNESLQITYTHRSYIDHVKDNRYFESNCFVILTANAWLFVNSNFTVRVTVSADTNNTSSPALENLTYDLRVNATADHGDHGFARDANVQPLSLLNYLHWASMSFVSLLLFQLLLLLLWLVCKRFDGRRKVKENVKNETLMEESEEGVIPLPTPTPSFRAPRPILRSSSNYSARIDYRTSSANRVSFSDEYPISKTPSFVARAVSKSSSAVRSVLRSPSDTSQPSPKSPPGAPRAGPRPQPAASNLNSTLETSI